jgi:hypothetical protein
MTPEERDMLEKTYNLVQENNQVLKKMKSSQRMGNIMRWFYWIFIIVLSVASFWLIQPYINSLQGAVGGSSSLNDILNQYK